MNLLGTDCYLGAYFEKNGFDKECYWGANGPVKPIEVGKLPTVEQEFHIDTTVDRFEASKDLPPMMTDEEVYEMLYSPFVRHELINKYGASDKFRINGDQQWIIFSEKLYKMGFFEDKSDEEILEMDSMLRQITASMDSFNYYNFPSDYINTGDESIGKFIYEDTLGKTPEEQYYMSKEEWMMELASSAEALRSFSKAFVAEDHQAEFEELIEKFYDYNSEPLENYQSLYEQTGIPFRSEVSIMNQEKKIKEQPEKETSFPVYSRASPEKSSYIDSVRAYFLRLSQSVGKERQNLLDHFPEKEKNQRHGPENGKTTDKMKQYWQNLFELQEKYQSVDNKG